MAGDFFSGLEQVDYYVEDTKNSIPVFYRNSRCFAGTFPASLLKLKKLLPDKRLVPAQVLPGVGAIQLMAGEYPDADVGPHNEFLIGILLNSPYFLQIPGYNLMRQSLQMYYHIYAHHIPVTSDTLARTDIKLGWNSFLASIDFTDSGELVACELKEEGELICRLQGRKVPARSRGIMKTFLYTVYNQQPIFSEVVSNMQQYSLSFKPSNMELSLSTSHPIANELSQLLISTKPLNYLYMPNFQSVFYFSEPIRLNFLRAVLEEGMRIPLDKFMDK